MNRGRATLLVFALLLASHARADDASHANNAANLSSGDILDAPPAYHLESVRARFTHYDQSGHGYQSRAGTDLGPGSEWLNVEQPQVEVVAKQGERITHRIWAPVDVITAASPDAVDAISTASRVNEAGSLDLTTTYHARPTLDVFVRGGYHMEEPLRSWNLGFGGARSLADDNAVLAFSINQIVDWFDSYNLKGAHLDRVSRSSTNGSLALTQLLSPTTVALVNYGYTLQTGELSNTWNSVPLTSGVRGTERLPSLRQRHAVVARVLQWLPWQGAVKAGYRFYADDWQVTAHTFDSELDQRIAPNVYVALDYRAHWQSGVGFFTTLADANADGWRTSDSDLAPFTAQTVGGRIVITQPLRRFARRLHADVGFDRYFRSNDLRASLYTCSLGLDF